jgi:OOP family OmpA-OmpF porin
MSTSKTNGSSNKTSDLSELKSLLFKEQRAQIEKKIEEAEESASKITSEKIADALPGAIEINLKNDPKDFGNKLKPTIEVAMEESVRENPSIITNIIYPVIGPAIRKSVQEMFRKMSQNTNKLVEESLSVQGLKWRVESALTGKSYSEIALLNSLVYRVEHLFLIHKESGLLIKHLINPNVNDDSISDSDMVSSMFSAIQDFARDAFQENNQAGISTLAVGSTTVWVERGPHAFLAAVIRGQAQPELREKMQTQLEITHQKNGGELRSFHGALSAEQHTGLQEILSECFQEQYTEVSEEETANKKRKLKFVQYGVLALLICGLGLWFWSQVTSSRTNREITKKLHALEHRLTAEPGVAVSSAQLQDKPPTLVVYGLADPFAKSPEFIAKELEIAKENVSLHFAGFFSPDILIVKRRFIAKTNPPKGVRVEAGKKPGTLAVSGKASKSWAKAARASAASIPGLSSLNLSKLERL